jgi:hypothetical protein
VLWITPPATSQALLANYGGIDSGFGGGMAQTGVVEWELVVVVKEWVLYRTSF